MRTICSGVCFVTAALAISGVAALGEPNVAPQRCRLEVRSGQCHFYVTANPAPLYREPSIEAKMFDSLPWVFRFGVDPKQYATMPDGWVKYKGETVIRHKRPDGTVKYERKKVIGWVQRNNLIERSELHKVSSCWPIESISFEEGDSGFDAVFEPDGSFKYGYQFAFKGHTYFADGIVEFRDQKGGTLTGPLGYNRETKKLFPNGLDEAHQQLFSQHSMRNCSDNPAVQKRKNKRE